MAGDRHDERRAQRKQDAELRLPLVDGALQFPESNAADDKMRTDAGKPFEDEQLALISNRASNTYKSPGPMRYEGGAEDKAEAAAAQSSSSDFERDATLRDGHRTMTRVLHRAKRFPIEVDAEPVRLRPSLQNRINASSAFDEGQKATEVEGLGASSSALPSVSPGLGERAIQEKEARRGELRQASTSAAGQPGRSEAPPLQLPEAADKLEGPQELARDRRLAVDQKLDFDDVCRMFGYDYCKKTIFKELEE